MKINESIQSKMQKIVGTFWLSSWISMLSQPLVSSPRRKMLEKLKFLDDDPTIYSLIQDLQVIRAKTRNLIYD